MFGWVQLMPSRRLAPHNLVLHRKNNGLPGSTLVEFALEMSKLRRWLQRRTRNTPIKPKLFIISHKQSSATSSGYFAYVWKMQAACSRWAKRRTSKTLTKPMHFRTVLQNYLCDTKRCVDITFADFNMHAPMR